MKKSSFGLALLAAVGIASAADGEFTLNGNIQSQASKAMYDNDKDNNLDGFWFRANIGGDYKSEDFDAKVTIRMYGPSFNNGADRFQADTYYGNYKWNNLGLNFPNGYIADGVNFDYSGGYSAMKKLLKLKDRPTAVFAAGDKLALGAIAAIRDEGMNVPDDFSVVGFDDIELARYVTPGLTTIRQNSTELGRSAADILVEQINQKKKLTVNKVIPVELVKRDSCRKIN